jgi:hypothetical protein
MLSHFPRGDQVPDVTSPCVGDEIEGATNPAECPNTLLAIVVAVIDRFDDLRVLEDQGGLEKIDLPPLPVLPALPLIP